MNRFVLFVVTSLTFSLSTLGLLYHRQARILATTRAELSAAQDGAKLSQRRVVYRERLRVVNVRDTRQEYTSLDMAIRGLGRSEGLCTNWADQEVPDEVRRVFN